MKHITHSDAETRSVAQDFAKGLKGGEVISLVGDLGSGKTTFVRGLVEALGGAVKVKSPTFTVMNEYPVNAGAIRRVVHLDFYRFEDAAELHALSLEDEKRPDTIIVAEWPNILPAKAWQADRTVQFTLGESPLERVITL